MATLQQLAHQAFIRAMEPCGPLTIQQKLDYLTDLAGMIAGHTEESLRQTPDDIELNVRDTPAELLKFARFFC